MLVGERRHIVDSQSWPYQSAAFPQLSTTGAFGPAEIYSATDIKKVVDYARARGVTVIPEIDTPGHVWAGLAAMEPAVLTTCYHPDGTVAGTGNLDPSKNTTFAFLTTLLAEIIPLFESGMFMVGGDEVQYDCWASNPEVVKFVKSQGWGSDMQKLESYYAQRLLSILASQSTAVMCWEDLFNNGLELRNDTLINVWSGGWEWCEKATSGSTVVRNNNTCSAACEFLMSPTSLHGLTARSKKTSVEEASSSLIGVGVAGCFTLQTGRAARGLARCTCAICLGRRRWARPPPQASRRS